MIKVVKGGCEEVSAMLLASCVEMQKFGAVAFIDSGNIFDPFFMKKIFHDLEIEDLRRVYVSRPFTAHQLRELVCKKLERFMLKRNVNFVIVSSVKGLFFDEIKIGEAIAIFREIVEKLEFLTLKYKTMTVVGCYNGSGFDVKNESFDKILEEKLEKWAEH